MTLRVVVDPGVLVSAFLVAGTPPAQVVDLWQEHRFELVVSPHLLDELNEVLRRRKFSHRVTDERRAAFMALLRLRGDRIVDPPPRPGLTGDPGDDYLAALVLASSATHLVTGDTVLSQWRSDTVEVVTPRDFVALFDE